MPTRHDAFISYSHQADGTLAAALESGLEKLAKPLLRLRALDVFRDQTSLSAAPALWPGIVAHLEASEWFLLLASPQSALSVWCNKELQWWLEHRSPERMLVLLTEGEIAWDRAAQDYDWSRTTCLPRLLERRAADEPLYVDLRWARGSDLLTLRNAKFRDAVVSIAAPIRGVPRDELDGADLRQLARNRRLVRGGVTAIAVAAIIAGWQAVIANQQRREAERQRDIAVARQLAAEAELMRLQQPDRLPLALLMAAAALRAQPDSLEAQQTLRGLLARSPAPVAVLRHNAPVSAAMLSDDLEQVATAAPANAGALWRVKDGTAVATLAGADRSVVYSGNGERIAGCCEAVAVWNRGGEELIRLTNDDLHGRAQEVAISPTGLTIAAGVDGAGGIGIVVYDVATKRLLLRKEAKGDYRGTPLAFSHTGDFFTADGTDVEWYEAGQWETPRTLPLGKTLSESPVERVAVSPDGRHLAVSANDQVALIALAEPQRPTLLRQTRASGPFDIERLVFDPGGRHVAAVPGMGPATIWAVGNGREIAAPSHGDFYTIQSLSFSPTHTEALTCATDGNCFTWSLATGSRLRQFAHVYAYQNVKAGVRPLGAGGHAKRGPLAVTAGRDQTARLWNLSDAGQEPRERCRRVVPYYSTYVALSRSWNVAEGPRDSVESTCDTWEDPDARPAPISGAKDLIAFTTTAGRIAALNRAGTGARLRVWDTRSGQLLLEQAVGFAVGNVKIDASDRHVIVTGKSPVVPEMLPLPAAVAIWDIAARRLVLELPEADGTIALDVARDGSRAAAVSNTGELRVWQLAGGQVQRAVLAAPGPVAFSENGRWLAAGGGSIRVLDASTLRPLAQIETGGRVHAIGFRSNGTLLAVRHYEAAAGMMVLDRFRWRTADMLSEACARLPLKAATEQWRQLMPNQAVADPCGGRAAPPRN